MYDTLPHLLYQFPLPQGDSFCLEKYIPFNLNSLQTAKWIGTVNQQFL